jgi:hypothetical protein
MAAYWMVDWNQMSNLSEEPSINNSDSWRRVREVSTLQKTPPFFLILKNRYLFRDICMGKLPDIFES